MSTCFPYRYVAILVLALLTLGPLQAGPNILRNPSFEVWHSDDLPAVWTGVSTAYDKFQDPAEAQFGNYAVRVEGSQLVGGFSQPFIHCEEDTDH